MEDEEMDKKVQEYMQRKGLRVAEVAPPVDHDRPPPSAAPHNVALAGYCSTSFSSTRGLLPRSFLGRWQKVPHVLLLF
jgi:hypothetical protein